MDLQALIEQLYEKENLTDNLTDDEARLLLDWGKRQITDLGVQAPESEHLDSFAGQVQRVMRAVNKLVGQKSDLSDRQLVEHLLALIDRAVQLGRQKSSPTGGG